MQLRELFVCDYRGRVAVKGKGKVETWHLVAKRDVENAGGDPMTS